MDCRTARLLLDFARPLSAELEGSEAEALEEHLADCAECGGLAQAERRLDDRLGSAMRAVPVPAALRTRLLTRLEANGARARRHRLLKASGLVAVAASVLFLAVFVGFGRRSATVVGPPDLVWSEVVLRPADPADVSEWFQTRYHRQVVAPPQLNYRFLAFFDLADFQGQRVPFLFFHRGDDRAYVYVLSDRDFDLSALENSGPSGYRVLVLRDAGHPHLAYLLLYTSEEPTIFLKDKAAQSAT